MKKLFFFLSLTILFISCQKETVDQAKIDKEILLKYIADNGLVVDSTPSGLYYVTVVEGTGAHPGPTSYVSVYYKGYFTNGIVFDQNPPGEQVSFFLNRVIAGWTEGIQLMKKSGKAKLLIPSGLAYGKSGYASIPPNTVLIFDVELANF